MDKISLRKDMLTLRKKFTGLTRARADAAITKRVAELPEWKRAETVCIYASMPTEVDTKKLIGSSKKNIVYPEDTTGRTADLYIIPGVAFDRRGNRLGRGRGFYDKFLAGVTVPKIGLAYSFQVLAEVPHSSYDVPMTMVVTEREVIYSRSEK